MVLSEAFESELEHGDQQTISLRKQQTIRQLQELQETMSPDSNICLAFYFVSADTGYHLSRCGKVCCYGGCRMA